MEKWSLKDLIQLWKKFIVIIYPLKIRENPNF